MRPCGVIMLFWVTYFTLTVPVAFTKEYKCTQAWILSRGNLMNVGGKGKGNNLWLTTCSISSASLFQVAKEHSMDCAWDLEQFGYEELKVSSKLELFKVCVPLRINFFNLLTLLSDQDRISPYNINPISSRQVMKIKEKDQLGKY